MSEWRNIYGAKCGNTIDLYISFSMFGGGLVCMKWIKFLFFITFIQCGISSSHALALYPLSSSPYTGGLKTIEKKKVIRVLVAVDLGFYYIEDGQPKGILAELLYHMEQYFKKNKVKISIQIIPVNRDELIPYLIEGYGDVIVANLTVTETRQKEISFTQPILKDISEYVINNISSPPIDSLKNLSGQRIWVRKSSSYYSSLLKVNKALEKEKLPPVIIELVDETIQDFEIVEMVNLGLINATVLDSHKTKIWQSKMQDIQINRAYPIREDSEIAWAIRKKSPDLLALMDKYIKTVKSGTLLGNIIHDRYLKRQKWLNKFLSPEKMDKVRALSDTFYKYSTEYDMNYLMTIAQGYQESGLDQSKISHKGAVGIMQVLPSTAKDRVVNISDIYNAKNNIHAGIKYMAYLRNRYFSSSGIDYDNQIYLSLAAYNAGPGNMRKMRRYAERNGYDPDVWFNNVEIVTRRYIGLEPVKYVRNIARYYIIYKQLAKLNKQRQELEKPFQPPLKYNPISLF